MGAITGTKAVLSEFSGDYKILVLTATITAASDTITLTQADHGIGTISGIIGYVVNTGLDADFATLQVSYSGLVITVVSKNAAGSTATDFTTTTITLTVIGY